MSSRESVVTQRYHEGAEHDRAAPPSYCPRSHLASSFAHYHVAKSRKWHEASVRCPGEVRESISAERFIFTDGIHLVSSKLREANRSDVPTSHRASSTEHPDVPPASPSPQVAYTPEQQSAFAMALLVLTLARPGRSLLRAGVSNEASARQIVASMNISKEVLLHPVAHAPSSKRRG